MFDEPGSEQALRLFAGATWTQSSRLLGPEAHGALARARHERRLTPAGTSRALEVLRSLLAQVEPVALTDVVASRGAELALTLRLRGADAVHLASYERVQSASTVFVVSDAALVRAARTLGHAVAVPSG